MHWAEGRSSALTRVLSNVEAVREQGGLTTTEASVLHIIGGLIIGLIGMLLVRGRQDMPVG